jgi:hypothetical protein
MANVPTTWVAHIQRGFDSIGYSDLKSDPSFGCIDPPPFGEQCTMPRGAALAACMAMPRCIAITCPDPSESHIGTRGITGPICQLRSSRVTNEKGHGMCKPGGCINVALSRTRRSPDFSNWRTLGGPGLVDAYLRFPALLFVHGDWGLHPTVLPEGMGRYWALQRGDSSAAIPNSGLLFAVDASPPNITDGRKRFPRRDLWLAERGGRAGGRRSRRSS